MPYASIFEKYKKLSVAVFGDYCLDEYLWLDASLSEASLETGDVAYQCIKQEAFPGAAGNIAKNLLHLGIGKVFALGFIGDDGRGLELIRSLCSLGADTNYMVTAEDRVTPAYIKPWLIENDSRRELNRIDIKNRSYTSQKTEDYMIEAIKEVFSRIDAYIIMDQIAEADCGVITKRVRNELVTLAKDNPDKIMYVDSRNRIDLFQNMILKGNQHEITKAAFGYDDITRVSEACRLMSNESNLPIICTLGKNGVLIYENNRYIALLKMYCVFIKTHILLMVRKKDC